MNLFYHLLMDLVSPFAIIKAVLILITFYIFSVPLALLLVKLFNIKIKETSKLKKVGFYKPLKLLIKVTGLYFAIISFNFSESPKLLLIINKVYRIITILLTANAFANSCNIDSNILKQLHKKISKDGDKDDDTLTGFISKVLKILIYIIAAVIIISELGYDINGLITGLGLAGLTVSLAAQDAAKNLFGGVIIIIDKPFKKGDWIKTSTFEGIVTEINFRSTRVRTFDDTILTVPNSTLANIEITNWSLMNKRKVTNNIVVEYSANLKQLSNCINKIEKMLRSDKKVHKDVINVYFSEISDSGYNIFVHYFTVATDYSGYLETKEEVNYKIMQILEEEKVALAYPSQALYIKK